MIPQRMPRNDFAGSELKERVAACRKRLRSRRFIQKPADGCEFNEDSRGKNASFFDGESAMRESLSSIEFSSAALDGGNDPHEMLLTKRTQEAGIT